MIKWLCVSPGYNFNPSSIANTANTIETYHRITEAMKFAYAKRSFLGDENFVDLTEVKLTA